jgi:hypothetical protein
MSGWSRQERKRGQDGKNITKGQVSWDRTTEIGHRGSHDSKVGPLHLGHDIGFDAGQDNPNRSVWTGWPDRSAWTAQARQDREGGMPGHDNNDQTLGQVSCEQEQDSCNRNQVGQDI